MTFDSDTRVALAREQIEGHMTSGAYFRIIRTIYPSLSGAKRVHRVGTVALLATLHSLVAAGPAITLTDGFFALEANLPWKGAITRSLPFEGGYGEPSETLWLPALGALVTSTAQIFVGTEASFGGYCPSGSCAPIVSSVRILSADSNALLSNPTVFLSPTSVSVKDYPSGVFNFVPPWQGKIQGSAGSGWEIGPSPILQKLRLEHSYTVPAGWLDLHAGPSLAISLDMHVTQAYQPFSVATYLNNAVSAASQAGATSDLARAAGAGGYVRMLRGTSGATSAFNTELRDAEYALYGYGAGLALRQFKALEFESGAKGDAALDGFIDSPFIQSPAGAAGWYFAKEVAQNHPLAGIAWKAIFNAPPGQTNNLPGTTDLLGGILANTRGFLHGMRGGAVDSLDDCVSSLFCSGSNTRLGSNARAAGALENSVAMPFISQEVNAAGGLARLSGYELSAADQATVDLFRADGHLFVFFAGSVEALDFGSGTAGSVLVESGGILQSFSLHAGQFSFLDAIGTAATTFVFLPDTALNSSAGQLILDFGSSDAGVGFMVTSVTAAVPEPSAGLLMGAGLLLFAWMARQRKLNRPRYRGGPVV
jgi:hypothetical protein